MDPKEYLRQYRAAVKRAKTLSDHIADLRAIAENLRTEDGHRVELDVAIANLVDAEKKVEKEVEQLLHTETEVACAINRVSDPYRELLYERYINGKTFEQIAVDMHYSYRQTLRIHGIALCIVKNVIECHN